MGKLEHILKKEWGLRIAELALNSFQIAERIELSKKIAKNNINPPFYYEQDPEIMFEYIERDKRMLEKVQSDDELRLYIETKVGRKAEDIFNYAALDSKVK